MNNTIDFCNLYIDWIKQNIEQYKISDNIYRVTLPFMDRNNDCTDIYIIKEDGGRFKITDDSYVLNDLEVNGFSIEKGSRREIILDSIVAAHGIERTNDNELFAICTLDNLPQKKHMLAQCMVKISDMFNVSKKNIKSIFLDDVQAFFDEQNIRYVNNISITGKSKLTTHYDFIISKSKDAPERLIKVVNNMDLNNARNVIFSWNDVKGERQEGAKMITFIRDNEKRPSNEAITALKEYGIVPACWTERDSFIKQLIA